MKVAELSVTICLFLAFISQSSLRNTVELSLAPQNETIIAFGSCFGIFDYKTHIFKAVKENDPQLWIWMGDAAYTDNMRKVGIWKDNSFPVEHIISRFNMTTYNKQYQEMIQQTQVIGVWDDHDYGCNNGDKTFTKKDVVRDVFLDFIGEPHDSQRRQEKGTGIYQDYVIKTQDAIKLHIILLDIRYDFDRNTNDRIGKRQLEWLESKFKEHNVSDVTFIASGIQVLPDRWFATECFKWPNKAMLTELINKYEKSGVVLLSGDVHFAQFYNTKCKSLVGYDLPELTTSGLTHHVNTFFLIGHHVMNMVTPLFWNASEIFIDYNFGVSRMKKSSDGQDIELTLEVKDIENNVRLQKHFSVKRDLQFTRSNKRYSQLCSQIHQSHQKALQLHHYVYVLINLRNYIGYISLAVILAGLSLPISGVLKLFRVIVNWLCRLQKKRSNTRNK